MKLNITAFGRQIISYGEYAFAKAGSIVVDTDEMTVQEVKELAAANKIEIKAKKKDAIISSMAEYLAEHNTEEKQMSNEEKYVEIVVQGFAKEEGDDAIKRALFNEGMDFGDLNKEFKRIVAERELRLTPKERADKTEAFLEGYVPENVEDHLGKISSLADHLKVATTLAGASMRKWAKDHDIELPKVKTASKSAPGFKGSAKIVADYAIENPDSTLEDLQKFASENIERTRGGKDSSGSYALLIFNALLMAREIYAPEASTEETEEVSEEA